ncbi:uncharacterized protein LOC107647882 [Arachis ipaensis]|uniref:uncharacterized protein LOC107647882 n=1 Tax=Arachis ipaensis TaxID=130454 RepID=UPI0007AF29CD|nr:uncharacterized protein LOC107647882 [Arachis ipaensis]XP_025627976.1 uncharacterized protein LOC112721119 [Arachis hypogaea]
MEGTVALLKTSLIRVGDDVDDSTVYFHHFFWTFPPCVEAFRHCKPLVSIDGTHLYGKYGGTLLLAIAQDGNSNILPIAFSLMDGKNAKSWSFFLTNLRQHVTPQQGILVISDRHNSIKAALENPNSGWLPHHAYRAFCIRHVAANFALSFKGTNAKRLIVNAAYAKTEAEFHYWFDIIRTENLAMCDWENKIEYDKWTQHQDGGRRFGHMTTNISECVNSVLKGTRNLPVTALVKSTYGRLAELFVIRGQTAEAQLASSAKFCQSFMKAMERNLRDSRCFTVTLFDRHQSEYTVTETTPTGSFSLGTYRVSLQDQGVQGVLDGFCAAKAPIPEGLWPPYDGATVIPDPSLRRCRDGRPRSTRIRNNMDEADPNRPKQCGLCRQPGHTHRSCPQRGSTVAGSS